MHIKLPKPMHGWRHFVGEVGIIVLGVLIALGAQQAAEAVQWSQKVDSAEAAMRIELAEDDGPQAYGRLVIGECLDQQLARIRDGAGRLPPDQLRHLIADYSPPFRIWDSEAWKAVVASDVGSHMGPERLVEWSSPYRVMPMLSEQNSRETQLATELRDGLLPTGEVSAEDVTMVRRTAGQLRMLNRRLMRGSQLVLARSNRNGAPVPQHIRQALLSQARTIYGACVRNPNPNAMPEAEGLAANLSGGSVSTN